MSLVVFVYTPPHPHIMYTPWDTPSPTICVQESCRSWYIVISLYYIRCSQLLVYKGEIVLTKNAEGSNAWNRRAVVQRCLTQSLHGKHTCKNKVIFAAVVHVTYNWFTLTVARTIDQNDHITKAMAHQNSEQVHEPWLEPVSNGY